MQEEKRNNPVNPGHNLDELSGIAGEVPLDKNLAWERLYPRLHKNGRRKMSGWYMMAAACILSVIFIFGINNLNKEKEMVKINPDNIEARNPAASRKPVKEANAVTGRIPLVKNEKTVREKESSINQNPVLSPSHKNKIAELNTGRNPRKIRPEMQNIPQPEAGALAEQHHDEELHQPPSQSTPAPVLNVNATAAATAAKVSKKKLRVVHVNELDEPAETNDNLAKNSGMHFFHLKWKEQPASPNSFSENSYIHNDLIKITLSSPN